MEESDIIFEVEHGLLDGHYQPTQAKSRQEQVRIKQRLSQALKQLKFIAFSFLGFSLFIILNDCIGLSSVPFYLPHITCNKLELSPHCKKLKNLTTGLYVSEMAGGFALTFQASIIYYYLDNFTVKHFNLLKITAMMQSLMGFFGCVIVVRIALFFRIIQICDQGSSVQTGKHFGMFLGNLVESKELAILVTLIVISMIASIFYLTIYSMRILKQVDELNRGKDPNISNYNGTLGFTFSGVLSGGPKMNTSNVIYPPGSIDMSSMSKSMQQDRGRLEMLSPYKEKESFNLRLRVP